MTWFIGDKRQYLSALEPIIQAYREIIGRHYPVMAVIEVIGFIEDGAILEIETTAEISDIA